MKSVTFPAAVTIALGLGALVAPPAVAGTEWGEPQAMSNKFGRTIQLSDNGRVAAWVRTNKLERNGPVRTAYYLKKKKVWTKAAVVSGSVDTSDVQLSRDGDYALIVTPGTGLQMAQRASKNAWGGAINIAAGDVSQASMSGDANTVVWADTRPSLLSYEDDVYLMSMTRPEGGDWGMPVELGRLPGSAKRDDARFVGLSRNGKTLVWMTRDAEIVASTKDDDGNWLPPTLLRKLPAVVGPLGLDLSAAGTRLAAFYPTYSADGIVTATRDELTWSVLSYVTLDGIWQMGMSPKGTTISYIDEFGDTKLRRWNGLKWRKAQVLDTKGLARRPRDLVQQNRTVAWSRAVGKALRASILVDGEWSKAKRLARYATSVGVSGDGRTVVWASPKTKRVYSIKR